MSRKMQRLLYTALTLGTLGYAAYWLNGRYGAQIQRLLGGGGNVQAATPLTGDPDSDDFLAGMMLDLQQFHPSLFSVLTYMQGEGRQPGSGGAPAVAASGASAFSF